MSWSRRLDALQDLRSVGQVRDESHHVQRLEDVIPSETSGALVKQGLESGLENAYPNAGSKPK